MPQNGELLWTARPFRRWIPPSSFATGLPTIAPRWMWTVLWIWNFEGRFWRWWYVASGQQAAYALGHEHGMVAGDRRVRREIRCGLDVVVGDAKR